LLILSIGTEPAVHRAPEFTPDNIERGRRVLERNDPRRMKAGVRRTVSISQEDLDLAANYLAHRYGQGSSRITLKDGTALVAATGSLPANPIGRFVNVDAALTETAGLPRFEHLRIGRLPVPAWAANWLSARAFAKLQADREYGFVTRIIKKVSIVDGGLSVIYEWPPNLPDKLRAVLLPPEEQERLRAYYERLGEVRRSLAGRSVSLTRLIGPLFRLGQERSYRGDPVAENRAAILVLAFHVDGRELASVVPAARNWRHPGSRNVTLNGRKDFAQHFVTSATIAANAGGALSDAVGLYKEVADSRGGSGFSFNDLAADRAGTRFGEVAAESSGWAGRLQQRLSAGVSEGELMPATEDLPEFMPEATFKRRFGRIGSPAYNLMMAKIERRIDALPLYR
jgi:hypothetical protein